MANEKLDLIDRKTLLRRLQKRREDFASAWKTPDAMPANAKIKYHENLECAIIVEDFPTVDAVVLPCKIGDMVYVISYCRCGKPECYEKKHCYKKETKRTPNVLAIKMAQQMGWVTAWNFGGVDKEKSGWKPKGTICYRVFQKPFELKMLAEVGKTVFLTLEDAEKALEERREGRNE